jgi:hypothetical protein
MSTYIDKKFINIISSKLEKFAWKKETLANCRCPICGDSQKHKNKARGFFFQKGNDFFFKCHNCAFSSNLYNFLEQVAPSLCKEYALERWKNGENGKSNYKKPKIVFEKPVFKKTDLVGCIPLSALDDDHICKHYVLSRKIPTEALSILYYTEDFASVAKAIDPDKTELLKESRLIIPIYDEDDNLIGIQGRYIGNNPKAIRYITIKNKNATRLWYGLNRVNDEPVYVVEGPIDSLFLPNGVATLGMDSTMTLPNTISDKKVVFVIDNEPRNYNVVETLQQLIQKKFNVVIWPNTVKEKDVNDMVLSGKTTQQIVDIINQNTYNGLQAQLKLNEWKKV